MVYVQQIEEGKLKDREEYKKKAKIGNESIHQKGGSSQPQFRKPKRHPPSSASAPTPRNRVVYSGRNSQNIKDTPAQSQGSVAQGGSSAPTCCEYDRNHPGNCRDGQMGCYKCGEEVHFLRECPKSKKHGGIW